MVTGGEKQCELHIPPPQAVAVEAWRGQAESVSLGMVLSVSARSTLPGPGPACQRVLGAGLAATWTRGVGREKPYRAGQPAGPAEVIKKYGAAVQEHTRRIALW